MARRAEPRVIDFTDCVMPRVIDFTDCDRWHPKKWAQWWLDNHVHFLDPLKEKGPVTYTLDENGKLVTHIKPVPAFRMKRARRILWECQQHPDWPSQPSMFFRHPSLKNVPYVVLKRLYQESEARNA